MPGLYVHEATLRFDADAGAGAPGAAITLALCGSWEHLPPCPLAAHYTGLHREEGMVRLRTIFASDPRREGEVRRRIDGALAGGSLEGPDGTVSRWTLLGTRAGELTTAEREHVRRIAGT